MRQERKRRRIGLQIKLNALSIISIILVSAGLALITYGVYCRKVDSIYIEQVERTALAVGTEGYSSHMLCRSDTENDRSVNKGVLADSSVI